MIIFVVNFKSTSNFISVPLLFPKVLFSKLYDFPNVIVFALLQTRLVQLFVVEFPNVEVEFPQNQFIF